MEILIKKKNAYQQYVLKCSDDEPVCRWFVALNYSELYIGIHPLPCYFFPNTVVKDFAQILINCFFFFNLPTVTEAVQSKNKMGAKISLHTELGHVPN